MSCMHPLFFCAKSFSGPQSSVEKEKNKVIFCKVEGDG